MIHKRVGNDRDMKEIESSGGKEMKENQTPKKGRVFKVIAIVVIALIAAFTAFDLWWNMPVSFLKKMTAPAVAYIEVRDGQTGRQFVIEEQKDISYIVTNIQGRHLHRDGISLGYVGTWFTLRFYNAKGKCVETLTINHYNTVRKDPFFYRDNDEGLCIDYLCDLEAELAGTWEDGSESE